MARINRRRFFLIGLVVLVGGWFGLPALFSEPETPEERVRAAIGRVLDGVGRADIGASLEPISRAYQDPDGADFAMVRGLLWREFQARGPITVAAGPMDVDISEDGGAAQARFPAMLLDGLNPAGLDLRANNADAFHFTVDLRLEPDDEWRITSHSRRDIQPQDVFR